MLSKSILLSTLLVSLVSAVPAKADKSDTTVAKVDSKTVHHGHHGHHKSSTKHEHETTLSAATSKATHSTLTTSISKHSSEHDEANKRAIPTSFTTTTTFAFKKKVTKTKKKPVASSSTSSHVTSTSSSKAKTTSTSSSKPVTTKTVTPSAKAVSLAKTSTSSASAKTTSSSSSGGLPFSKVVAFGDNLSDNGNGSYAYCIADPDNCKDTIYGYRTWTDGPVAISYLVDLLDVPLAADYAVGHADGGGKLGATIDNNYTLSAAGAPSAIQQVANYTSTLGSKSSIADTLLFLWTGNNDINLYHIDTGKADNPAFATAMSTKIAAIVQSLIDAGAEHIIVPNLYPKHISPSNVFYCSDAAAVANLGASIAQANAAIEAALVTFGSKVIYYDVYSFMLSVWNNAASYGITHVGGEFCDGYSDEDWQICFDDKKGYLFYWMQYVDMTSYVHSLIAADMNKAIEAHFSS